MTVTQSLRFYFARHALQPALLLAAIPIIAACSRDSGAPNRTYLPPDAPAGDDHVIQYKERSSQSDGNSMAPAMLISNEVRSTKIDRPADVTSLVDVGDLVGLLREEEVVSVMESMYHLSKSKMSRVAVDESLRQAVACKYLESAGLAERYSNPASLNPLLDPDIVARPASSVAMNLSILSSRRPRR